MGFQIAETLRAHESVSRAAARAKSIELLDLVGIPDPDKRVDDYPHQLSGGMQQRVMIAIALSCNPKILIADEPTTALDVTIQAQILDLIAELKERLGMSVILITHDLGIVAEMCEEVVVMYLGEVVEQAGVRELFKDPLHPYTRALLRSIPRLGLGKKQELNPIEGTVPDPFTRPSGCPFHPRCEQAVRGRCDQVHPELITLADGRSVRCIFYEQIEE